jgi:hypothetical protein
MRPLQKLWISITDAKILLLITLSTLIFADKAESLFSLSVHQPWAVSRFTKLLWRRIDG